VPELPEVETVRAGLDRWVTGRTIATAEVRHPRAVRRHVGGGADLVARLPGRRVAAVSRRGKYLWLPLREPAGIGSDAQAPTECLIAHLGMSGQLLLRPPSEPYERHMHVRISFADTGPEVRFVDQRTFGGVLLDALIPATDRPAERLPERIAHIARDPLDPEFDERVFVARLRSRNSAVKRAVLDQTLVSGIGNIYADESLWRARVHGERLCRALSRAAVLELLGHVRAVLREAVQAGGTSFDALYVNVNGESGYFDRSLAVYGQEGRPCPRCGTAIRRAAFMNRSSFFCPRCQPRPRRPAGASSVSTPRR
jgi:formamidopyrimidine-DNA glycosylase